MRRRGDGRKVPNGKSCKEKVCFITYPTGACSEAAGAGFLKALLGSTGDPGGLLLNPGDEDRNTLKQTDIQTDGPTDRQTEREQVREQKRETRMETERKVDGEIHTHTYTHIRAIGTHTNEQTVGATDSQTGREKERENQGENESEAERQGEKYIHIHKRDLLFSNAYMHTHD
jgi:hypothetical protein